ncbi:PREDICTED: putative GTP cyclohydrolase 1 type 2 NIF3L1 isoform X1 [Ceratosolen solmsi marchali]|uniref:NIF3-like protein 1 n=1 Tax=Ceratosolen solmsi marchali TaxID=326594 RepID=A0AAJ6YSB8_9HYME|nr:PREDICTED: putative GTP cyclohydrolase 1 type 2 NIF3L1 isoform X1 [Ceratosolen solmsi marchali]
MFGFLFRVLKFSHKTQFAQKLLQKAYTTCDMSTYNKKGLALGEVINSLNSYANITYAASWDNVGLLIEPTEPKNISHILLTNDLTEKVMQEAIDIQTDMIISYHPPIFKALRTVTTNTWKERIVAKCLENKIALYSPHTSFDSIQGGVNDWLTSAFDIKESYPIEPGEDPRIGMGRYCTLKNKITVDEAVNLIKYHTRLDYVRLARAVNSDGYVSKVGLCAGAGTSVLQGLSADLYVTGEMLHHDILDAVHKGTSVILTNHSDSERGFLKHVFAKKLSDALKNAVAISVSVQDEDPLKTV